MARLISYFRLARPRHYLKNGFIFVPLFFSHNFFDLPRLLLVTFGFIALCLAASAVYVFNDLIDVAQDRQHPTRCGRPLAAGEIGRGGAVVFLLLLLVTVGATLFLIADQAYAAAIAAYLLLNIFYSLWLQKIVGLDVLCVSLGFVLRVLAGAVIIGVSVSNWLAGLTFLLALLLVFAKRRCDLAASGAEPGAAGYNLKFLTIGVVVLAGVSILAYLSYTLSPAVIAEHGAPNLYFSAIWVVLGLGRYLTLVFFVPQPECSPVLVVSRDSWLQLSIFLWLSTLWLIIYTDVL